MDAQSCQKVGIDLMKQVGVVLEPCDDSDLFSLEVPNATEPLEKRRPAQTGAAARIENHTLGFSDAEAYFVFGLSWTKPALSRLIPKLSSTSSGVAALIG